MTPSSNTPIGLRSSRAAAVILLVFSIVYGLAGRSVEYAFSSDPLGPRVFPVMLAIVLGLLSLAYLVRPGDAEAWPRGYSLLRSIALIALLVISVLVLEPLGFAVSMFVLTAGVASVFGASWRASIIGGGLQAALWYFVFAYLLEVYLPSGDLFAK